MSSFNTTLLQISLNEVAQHKMFHLSSFSDTAKKGVFAPSKCVKSEKDKKPLSVTKVNQRGETLLHVAAIKVSKLLFVFCLIARQGRFQDF